MLKQAEVVCELDNSDKGKVFRLTRMSAVQSEKWAWRAISALGKSGIDMPEELFAFKMEVVAAVGIHMLMRAPWGEVEPLLDEMKTCIEFKPDNAKPVFRPLVDSDIDEPVTILWLRDEVMHLHTGFSPAAMLLSLGVAARERLNTQNTSMSQGLSEQSSEVA